MLHAGSALHCLEVCSLAWAASCGEATHTSGLSLRCWNASLALALTRETSWGVIRRTAMSIASGTSSMPVLNSTGAVLPSGPLVVNRTCMEAAAWLPKRGSRRSYQEKH